jgi:hypothetical protein
MALNGLLYAGKNGKRLRVQIKKRKFFSFQIAFVNSQVYSGNNYMHRAKKPDAYNLEKVVAAKPVN